MARVGGSRVFFDVIGVMNTAKMVKDAQDSATVIRALYLDAFEGITGSLDGIFGGVTQAVEALRDPAMELGESQIFFRKFFDFDDVAAYESRIMDLGVAFGFTASEALEAGAKMAQLGGQIGGQGAVEGLTEASMLFGLVGGMTTEDAATKLVSLGQQTGFFYEGTTREALMSMDAEEQRQIVLRNSLHAMDQLNTVENNSLATMSQLSEAMDNFSASATISNESLANQAAQAAILIQSGERASKAGRGLRTIYTRLATDTGGAATALHEVGVATTDASGELIGLNDILTQLHAVGFAEMGSGQQQFIAQTVAGTDHATRFLKLMESFDELMELSGKATEGSASALDEFSKMTDNATFAQRQMQAATESNAQIIGQELLPAITNADGMVFSLQESFKDLITVEEDLDGISGTFDRLGASLVGGVARTAIMSGGLYDIAGGAFEAFLNIQSLMVSIQVFRSIDRQTKMLSAQATKELAQAEGFHVNMLNQEMQAYMRMSPAARANIQLYVSEIDALRTLGTVRGGSAQAKVQATNMEKGALSALMPFLSSELTLEQQLAIARQVNTGKTKQKSLVIMEAANVTHHNVRATQMDGRATMEAAFAYAAAQAPIKNLTAAKKGLTMTTTRLTGVLALSSMALMFFPENEDAMQASMILMTLSMVPMIVSMMSFKTTTDGATVSLLSFQSVASGGLALGIGVAAILGAMAVATMLMDNSMGDLSDSTDQLASDLNGIQDEFSDFTFALDNPTTGAIPTMQAFGDATADSMNKAQSSVKDFMSARQELFYGFSASRMQQSLFKELVNQGVGELYYRSEITVNNNFFGLTADEMVDKITTSVMNNLNTSVG